VIFFLFFIYHKNENEVIKMSELRAFKPDFEPIARVGEKVLLLPQKKLYEVLWVQSVQPILKNLGSLTAGASSTKVELKTELELEENELGQWRFEPVDDVQLAIFSLAANRMFSTRYTDTAIELQNPKHTVFIPGGSLANAVVWTVTPGRIAKITCITVAGGAVAQKVRFSDAGTDKISVQVPVNNTMSYGENQLPDTEFFTAIWNDVLLASDVDATIEIEETNAIDTFKDRQNMEVFNYHDDVPSAQVTNPTNYTQTRNRISISGFRYKLKPIEVPEAAEIPKPYIAIPVRAMPQKAE